MNIHEPRPEFVERLRTEVARRVDARQGIPGAWPSPWLWRPRWVMVASLFAIVLVSMTIGGAVVAAAYQSQTNERRQLLAASYELRVGLASKKLEVAKTELEDAQRRVDVGVMVPADAAEARVKVREAEAQLASAMLNLEEVRITGQDPLDSITAPLVKGRDFVLQRLEQSLQAPMGVLESEKIRLAAAQRRFEIGLAQETELLVVRGRIREIEGAITALQQKIDLRRRFVKGEFDAAVADLQLLLTQTEQKRQALVSQIELANREASRVKVLFDKGLVNKVEIATAQLRVMELQTEMSRLDIELQLIQQQLKQRRGK